MSELLNTNDNRATIRWKLLTSVSALALAAYVSSTGIARAEDADHPPIWIELGGQAAWNQTGQDAFLSPLVPVSPPPFEVASPATLERPASVSWNGNAAISFEPVRSDWKLSAAIVYGRSSRKQSVTEQTQQPNYLPNGAYAAFRYIQARSGESHAILDFQAGRDFGLGAAVSSSVNLGVRYVQFNAGRNTLIQSQPTNVQTWKPRQKVKAVLAEEEKFSGIGPSISWDANAAIAGNTNDGELGIDWGINAAVLFGRQSVRGHHQTTKVYYTATYAKSVFRNTAPLNRGKQVIVPNIGGFAGVSWRYPNAKISLGYRADMFFGAMDGGIDTRKSENVGFYGPFASVSIGLGG